MPAEIKTKLLDELKALLAERENFVLTTYSGLSVVEIGELRAELRAKDGRMKVVKNNLFRLALQQSEHHKGAADSIAADLTGPIAVTFTGGDLPAATKVLVDYAKKTGKIELKSGSLDGQYLDPAGVQQIANLPSREELLSIIGRGLNTPAQKIATGMNQIIAGLARGIKAVGEKNG